VPLKALPDKGCKELNFDKVSWMILFTPLELSTYFCILRPLCHLANPHFPKGIITEHWRSFQGNRRKSRNVDKSRWACKAFYSLGLQASSKMERSGLKWCIFFHKWGKVVKSG
jgi:hypothetical protein